VTLDMVTGAKIYKTEPEERLEKKVRREELTALGLCINGRNHGDATHGVLCERCHQHRNPEREITFVLGGTRVIATVRSGMHRTMVITPKDALALARELRRVARGAK
jgi:hypothetical protein